MASTLINYTHMYTVIYGYIRQYTGLEQPYNTTENEVWLFSCIDYMNQVS